MIADRSSPIPAPDTVLYGSREAPVLERHCVEGGEFIIAWLSHSKVNKSCTSKNAEMQHSSAQANGNRPPHTGNLPKIHPKLHLICIKIVPIANSIIKINLS